MRELGRRTVGERKGSKKDAQMEERNMHWETTEREAGDGWRVCYYKPCLISAASYQFGLHQPALLDYKRFSVPAGVGKVTQSQEQNGTQSGPARGARSVLE